MTNSNNGLVVKFTDRYGDEKIIHNTRNGLTVKRAKRTVALMLTNAIKPRLGKKIKEQRIKKGMTLEQLCSRAGISSATPKSRMFEIENASDGRGGIKLGTLYALAIALDLDPKELLPSVEEIMNDTGITMGKLELLTKNGR